MPAIPPELQQAINAAAFPIMAKLKIRGPLSIVLDPPPAPPAGLTATASLSGVLLAWTANTEPDLAPSPYRIYRNGSLLAGPQSGASYADASAHAGTQYAYTVTASDAAGNESAPAAATATRPAPPAVTNFSAAATIAHDVALSWQASTDPAHASYELARSTNGIAFSSIASPTGTTYTDTAPPQNITLFYRVFDVNNNNDIGPGTNASTLIDTAAPAALANLRITGITLTSISLAWDASTAPDLAGYKIERSVNGAAFTTLAALQSPTTFTDNGVSSGFPYTYRVTAIDTSNNASQPATITASIPAPLAAPANLVATPSTSGIALTWSAVTGAASYRVSSSQSSTGPFVPIGPPSTNSYNDTAAAVGTTTYYRVWAVDSLSQQGSVASVSAVRPAPGGVGFPRVGVGSSIQTAASVIAPHLGHFTHFSAFHLVQGGQDWKDVRFQWSFGEVGTQYVVDPRDGTSIHDASTDCEGPNPFFRYTTAGQKNVSVTLTDPLGVVRTYSCVVNVPPAGRAVNPVGPSQTFKTMADVKAHLADNTEWVLDAGTYPFSGSDLRLGRNVLLRAATPGTVTIHAASGTSTILTGWPGQTQDATVEGINFDSDYTNSVNGDGTPYHKSFTNLATERGENVGFADCTVAVMNECWKGSEVTNLITETANLYGAAHLRCHATDPIGVMSRTFWVEGVSYKMMGCSTLNSMTESPERNANTAGIETYRQWNDIKQTMDPANHRTGAKAAGTNRALKRSAIRACRYGGGDPKGGDLSFDPHTSDAHDSDNLIEANLIYGQFSIQGNTDNMRVANNVLDRRGGNNTGIALNVNGLPIDGLEIINNTMIGDSIHQPLVYIGSYNVAALPHLLTNLVIANNLNVNPNLKPIAGNNFSASITINNQDVLAVARITGNVHPDVTDWHGGKKLLYSGLSTLSPDYLLTLAQWNTTFGAADVQAAVALNGAFAPPLASAAATAGKTDAAFNLPVADYHGQASAAKRVGACNPA